VTWVAVQTVLFATGRGLIAGIVIFPLGFLIIGASAMHVTWGNVTPSPSTP
jgi:hypothetical protein